MSKTELRASAVPLRLHSYQLLFTRPFRPMVSSAIPRICHISGPFSSFLRSYFFLSIFVRFLILLRFRNIFFCCSPRFRRVVEAETVRDNGNFFWAKTTGLRRIRASALNCCGIMWGPARPRKRLL